MIKDAQHTCEFCEIKERQKSELFQIVLIKFQSDPLEKKGLSHLNSPA